MKSQQIKTPHHEKTMDQPRQQKEERDQQPRLHTKRLEEKTKTDKPKNRKRSAIDQFLAEAYKMVNKEKSSSRSKLIFRQPRNA